MSYLARVRVRFRVIISRSYTHLMPYLARVRVRIRVRVRVRVRALHLPQLHPRDGVPELLDPAHVAAVVYALLRVLAPFPAQARRPLLPLSLGQALVVRVMGRVTFRVRVRVRVRVR